MYAVVTGCCLGLAPRPVAQGNAPPPPRCSHRTTLPLPSLLQVALPLYPFAAPLQDNPAYSKGTRQFLAKVSSATALSPPGSGSGSGCFATWTNLLYSTLI